MDKREVIELLKYPRCKNCYLYDKHGIVTTGLNRTICYERSPDEPACNHWWDKNG